MQRRVTIERDELDIQAHGLLPLRTILSYFERGRTNMFGGPNNLRKMQDEDGILAVVTSVRDLSLFWTPAVASEEKNNGTEKDLYPTMVEAGQQIVVNTAVEVKRKGMILEFHQSLSLLKEDMLISKGRVYLMMINAETRRPTSKLPPWAWELLDVQDGVK
mmetsp:Transcript_22206/g.41355  ORF Transcript_22206/g.41355 Transcript_22206/m.41355 type:complete len:161 (+) Transcript_22206:1-483(+)